MDINSPKSTYSRNIEANSQHYYHSDLTYLLVHKLEMSKPDRRLARFANQFLIQAKTKARMRS